jgi:hypothetical protein
LRQDTIHILLLAPAAKGKGVLHSRLTFVINRYDDLQNLVTTGLNAKMQKLEPDDNRRWEGKDGEAHLVSDPTIISGISIYSANHEHDYLSIDAAFAVQNYKNYFVPSVSLGTTIGLQKGEYWHRLGVHWEPLFFFATNNQGQLQTFRNDLLVFNFDYSPANGASDKENNFGLRTNFSLGTFVHREGNYFPANSFRLTVGEVNLMRGRFSIDPCLYFNDFFRNVTPGLRFCFKVM